MSVRDVGGKENEKAERLVWELSRIIDAIRKTPLKYLFKDKGELKRMIRLLKQVVEWLP